MSTTQTKVNAAPIQEIKSELGTLSYAELMEFSLKIIKFKKESKELATYLLFDARDETGFVEKAVAALEKEIGGMDGMRRYPMQKRARKAVRLAARISRYTPVKESAAAIHLQLYKRLQWAMQPQGANAAQTILRSLYAKTEKLIDGLDPDLQFDYKKRLNG